MKTAKAVGDSISAAGGRTFALTVGAGLVTSILLYLGKLDSGGYSTIILGTVGVYITANAYAKGVQINADKEVVIATGTPSPAPTPDTSLDTK